MQSKFHEKPVFSRHQKRVLLIAISAVLFVTMGSKVLFTSLIMATKGQGPVEPEVDVLFLAPEAELTDSFVLRALQLDGTLQVEAFDASFDGNFSKYDVVVLDSSRGLDAI
nr:hypothetical protein [Candidatus Sigynarchaeota archaeon]